MHRLKSVSEQLPDESEHTPGREMGELDGFSVTGLLLGASEGLFDGFEVGASVTGLLLGVSLGLFEGAGVGWIRLLKE